MSGYYEVNFENEAEIARRSCYDWEISLFLKSFHIDNLIKNDPSLRIIIDTVNQEESYPDPTKNIKTKTNLFIHKDKKKNLVFWDL